MLELCYFFSIVRFTPGHRHNWTLACFLFGGLGCYPHSIPAPKAHGNNPLPLAIQHQREGEIYGQIDRLIDSLAVQDGMTILDIGAGVGLASFRFAKKLHGTGEVFSTDIASDRLRAIQEEAKLQGLRNVFPVPVREEGLDPFYLQHHYDLIFVANVYHALGDRERYFSELRPFLKPQGRLVIVHYNTVPPFVEEDFAQLDPLLEHLTSRNKESPFYRRLPAQTKNILKTHPPAEAVKDLLVTDFNRLLSDPTFYREFLRDSRSSHSPHPFAGSVLAIDLEFSTWLLSSLKGSGLPEETTLRAARKLNRLFFIKEFGNLMKNNGRAAYARPGNVQLYTSRAVILRELSAAGYQLQQEIQPSTFYTALVFKSGTSGTPTSSEPPDLAHAKPLAASAASLFSEKDLIDLQGIKNILLQKPEDNPFVRALSPVTHQLIRDEFSAQQDGSALRRALIADFNRILLDPTLYRQFDRMIFRRYYKNEPFNKLPPLTDSERDFANWLLLTLNEARVLGETPRNEKDLQTLLRLNRLYFTHVFGNLLTPGS